MKKLTINFLIFTILFIFNIYSRIFDSPLPLLDGYMHYPVNLKEEEILGKWTSEFWFGGYHRHANSACDNNCKWDAPLAVIFFEQPTFKLSQVFEDSIVKNADNLFLNIDTFSPDISFNEKGIHLGAKIRRDFGSDGAWRGGLRFSVPLRILSIKNNGLNIKKNNPDQIFSPNSFYINFIDNKCLNFNSFKCAGIGDFLLEPYAGHEFSDGIWAELATGVILPNSKKSNDFFNIFATPLGAEGHYQLRLRGIGYFDFNEWLKFKADLSCFWVLSNCEKISPPFVNTIITGIPAGPNIDADIFGNIF